MKNKFITLAVALAAALSFVSLAKADFVAYADQYNVTPSSAVTYGDPSVPASNSSQSSFIDDNGHSIVIDMKAVTYNLGDPAVGPSALGNYSVSSPWALALATSGDLIDFAGYTMKLSFTNGSTTQSLDWVIGFQGVLTPDYFFSDYSLTDGNTYGYGVEIYGPVSILGSSAVVAKDFINVIPTDNIGTGGGGGGVSTVPDTGSTLGLMALAMAGLVGASKSSLLAKAFGIKSLTAALS